VAWWHGGLVAWWHGGMVLINDHKAQAFPNQNHLNHSKLSQSPVKIVAISGQ
jgi:hypothetical protein